MRIIVAALAAVLAFACFPALAGPPPKMWQGSFRAPAVICNTADEVRSIVEAGNARPDGGAEARYGKLKATPGHDGEPTCLIVAVANVVAGESIELGDFSVDAKTVMRAWAVHVGTMRGEWWMLYAESKAVADPTSFRSI